MSSANLNVLGFDGGTASTRGHNQTNPHEKVTTHTQQVKTSII
jgi:hypothetical protein